MMEENSKTKRKKPRQPLNNDKEFTEFLEMVRGFRAYSKVRQASHYRANASTTKNTGEHALIYGSVTLKTHSESALICESGLKMAF